MSWNGCYTYCYDPCYNYCNNYCYNPCYNPCYNACSNLNNSYCPPQPVTPTNIFRANLTGQNEVPPNSSAATGTLVGTLSANEQRFDYALQTTGLTNITVAHFHDGAAGVIGPIVKDIPINPATGTATASWTTTDVTQPLTPALVQKLKQGLIYVNVHTTQFPNGEIRDQVRKAACT